MIDGVPDAPCPVCGSRGGRERFVIESTRPFHLVECDGCGLAYCAPRPTEEELAAFYSDTYFSGGDRSSAVELGYDDYEGSSWAAANARDTWASLTQWRPQLGGIEPRSLLDVGCATGAFAAAAAADGWEASGVEVSDYGRLRAAARGLRVWPTLAEAEGPFGLITMFHVAEHVLDPVGMLAGARALVADGGRLVVEVPNWGSAGRRARQRQWRQLRPPEHINFFDRRALHEALVRGGWTPEVTATFQPDVMNRAMAGLRRQQRVQALALAAAATTMEGLGLGGHLRVVATPAPPR